MAAPAVTETTRRWWESLPDLYRAADEAQADGPSGYPLLRFLSLLGDQADDVATLVDRIALHDDGTGDYVSDLADPRYADDDWLWWLAWLVGVTVEPGSGSAETFDQLVRDYETFADLAADNATFADVRRHADVVPGGDTGPDALRSLLLDLNLVRYQGSTAWWEALITPHLTGAKRVLHQRVFDGDAWHLRLVTYLAETPTPARVAFVIDRAVKADGLVVDYDTREGSSFDEVEAGFATFGTIVDEIGSFGDLAVWLPPG